MSEQNRPNQTKTPVPSFSPLPENIQTRLLEKLSSRFQYGSRKWRPLYLNGLNLGLLDAVWQEHLRYCHNCLDNRPDGLHLTAGSWRETGDILQRLARGWYEAGLFHGWRNEYFDVRDAGGRVLFALERAAFRPFGLYSRAIHINGLTHTSDGWRFWISRRSSHKAVDPDKLDNLVGGGIAAGETADEAMRREAWEEAGLPASLTAKLIQTAKLHSLRISTRGLHREYLHIYDAVLPKGAVPKNQDGEVADFLLLTAEELAESMCGGEMADDSMLVTLDLFRRMGLVGNAHPLTAYLADKAERPKNGW